VMLAARVILDIGPIPNHNRKSGASATRGSPLSTVKYGSKMRRHMSLCASAKAHAIPRKDAIAAPVKAAVTGNGIDRERRSSNAFEECAGNSRRDAGEHGIDEAMHGGKLPGSADNAQHGDPPCNDQRAVSHCGSYESCAASLPQCVPGPATGFCGRFLVSHQVRARLSFVCHILSLAPTSSSSRISQIFRNRSW